MNEKNASNADTLLFEEFVRMLKKRLKDQLPEDYRNAEIRTFEMRRLNDTYNAMQLIRPGYEESPIPVINLDALYNAYFSGMPWEDIMRAAAGIVLTTADIDIQKYSDYDYARSHLMVRVSNWQRNEDISEEFPCRRYGDIMLTYHIMHSDSDHGIASARISNEMMKDYGIDACRLHQDALMNSARLFPAVLLSVEEAIGVDMSDEKKLKKYTFPAVIRRLDFSGDNIYCLTHTHGVGGASAMFYPHVLSETAKKAGSDLYIIPSSVHEVLIAPVRDDIRPEFLKEMVISINKEKMMLGIKLADCVFRFNRENGTLSEI